MDLEKLAAKKKFTFVDGLSGLFLPKQNPISDREKDKILVSAGLQDVSKQILASVQQLKGPEDGGKVLLVIDQLDLLLAASGEGVDAVGTGNMLMGLREVSTLHFTDIEKFMLMINRMCMQQWSLIQQTIHWFLVSRHH